MNNDNKTQHLFMEADRGVTVEKDGQRRCMGCMELYSTEYDLCPHCGYQVNAEVENALHMYPGTVLNEKYVVGKVLGYGGFGVTYLAWDTILQIKVAIKEYLPSEFSTRSAGQTRVTVFSGEKSKQFSDGLDKFVDEAKRLAMFRNEPGIVKIFDSFEENGTAYIAMEYLEGETLAEYLEREKTVPIDEAVQMLMPVIESLNKVHYEGIIHRDIAPDNIFLTNKGEVKLIDFGASRYATTSRSRSLTVIIKPGYSAEEQYRSRGDQGSHTDVYSIGAVLYRMVTGQTPPDAMERRAQYEKNRKDILVPISKITKGISKSQENSILNAMNVRIEDRSPDMISLAGELLSEEPVKRRKSGLRKIDPLTWPLWAKIGVPSGIVAVVVLSVLLAFGIIGPKSTLRTDFNIPDGQTLVPDVVADELEDAQKRLEDSQLNLRISDRIENAIIKKDMVLLQNPDAFNTIEIGSFIDIIISDGFGTAFVPDVVNKTLEEATALLEEAGFIVVTQQEESDIVAPGSVISQSVDADTGLEKGSEITLVISTGSSNIDTSRIVKVPDLTGITYEQAITELKKYGLYINRGPNEYNEALPVNQIIGQYPSSGTEAHSGDSVTVTVNMGAKTVNVPSVELKKLASAQQELEVQGLKVNVKYEESSSIAAGTVIRQSPSSGASVKINSTVTLVVSSGYSVTVPNVKNMALEDAQELLVEKGLTSTVSGYESSSTVAKGKVISQNVSANSKVEQGTRIGLVVSTGAEEEATQPAIEKVSLTSLKIASSPSKTNYYVGDSFNSSGLKVVAAYSDGTEKDVTGKCSLSGFDSSNGGSTTVKASYSENGVTKTASFTVQVLKPSIDIIQSSVSLVKGGTGKVTVTLIAPTATTVSWSSANTAIATVSSDGTVKGVGVGETKITGKITYAGKSYADSVFVYVESDTTAVDSVTLNKESATLYTGDSLSLTATILPTEATNKNVSWSSSDTSVATVSSSGIVTAKSAGTAKITVKTADGGETDDCIVTVNTKKYTVTVNKGTGIASVSDGSSYEVGKKVTLKATVSSGYTFDRWKGSGTNYSFNGGKETITFEMPPCDVSFTASATKVTTTQADDIVNQGTCGDNIDWVLYENGLLYIYGEGDMSDYSYSSSYAPWYKERDKITAVAISTGVTSIGVSAFYDCYNLARVDYQYIKNIKQGAFYGCASLKSFIIQNSVEEIGTNAFYLCTGLTKVTIPKSVTKIGNMPFGECYSLTTISVDKANNNYSSDSFGVLFNKSQSEIIEYPCGNTRTSYTVPNSVQEIGSYAFADSTYLTHITISDSVRYIEIGAFVGCTNLKELSISNSLETIESGAFVRCNNLRTVYYSGTAAEWEEIYIGSNNDDLKCGITCSDGSIAYF